MSIKYYHLAKDEIPPEEFCAIRDVGGEPSEYVFYVPDAENAKLKEELEAVGTAAYLYGRSNLKSENAQLRQQLADATESMGRVEERCAKLREQNDKLRELAMWSIRCSRGLSCHECPFGDMREATVCSMLRYAERLGIEVD